MNDSSAMPALTENKIVTRFNGRIGVKVVKPSIDAKVKITGFAQNLATAKIIKDTTDSFLAKGKGTFFILNGIRSPKQITSNI